MSFGKKLNIISLFSGAGGLDIGFAMAGFNTAVMVERDASCCKTLRRNLPEVPLIEGDITEIATSEILEVGGLEPLEAAMVVGGPPCQSFSLAGKRMGLDDPRGRLVLEFIRVVREALPVGFLMENVRGLSNWNGGKALDAILEEATRPIEYLGKTYRYRVCWKILDAADFGVPQHRERIFIVGNRIGKGFSFPEPKYGDSHEGEFGLFDGNENTMPYRTVWNAIGNLPPANPPSETAMRVSKTIKGRREKYGY